MAIFGQLRAMRLWYHVAIVAAVLLVCAVQWFRSRRVRRRSPKASADLEQGIAAYNQRNFAAAASAFTRVLDRHPDDTETMHLRAMARYELKDWRGALADMNQVLAVAPHDAELLNLRGNARYSLALFYHETDRLEPAIVDFSKALEIDPSNHVYLINRGCARRRLSQLDAALEDFNAALRLAPDNVAALEGRAVAWARLGQPDRARRDAARVFAQSGQTVEDLDRTSYLKMVIGDVAAGFADLEEACRQMPDDASRHNGIAWRRATLAYPGERDPQRALAHARRACELSHWKVAACIDTLAAAFADAGDFQRARQCQEHLINSVPAGSLPEDYKARLTLYEQCLPCREELL